MASQSSSFTTAPAGEAYSDAALLKLNRQPSLLRLFSQLYLAKMLARAPDDLVFDMLSSIQHDNWDRRAAVAASLYEGFPAPLYFSRELTGKEEDARKAVTGCLCSYMISVLRVSWLVWQLSALPESQRADPEYNSALSSLVRNCSCASEPKLLYTVIDQYSSPLSRRTRQNWYGQDQTGHQGSSTCVDESI